MLGTVVQVALELAARTVAGFDGSGARCAELPQLRASLRLQALAVEREAGGAPDVLEVPGIVNQLAAVDEHGDWLPEAHQWR